MSGRDRQRLVELEVVARDEQTLRRWLLAEGLRQVPRQRPKHHTWRPRKAAFGELIQLDGEPALTVFGRACHKLGIEIVNVAAALGAC